jgi:predicted Holliday junction resolvase-like endonuclease
MGLMTVNPVDLALGILIGALAVGVYVLAWKVGYTRRVREDAVQRSLAVTAGKVHEQLVPLLPEFRWNPKDARFLGSPVDLVVFDGLSEGRVRRIVFVEVKTGGATLTGRERMVREAVRDGAVEWVEMRVGAGERGVA